MPWERHIESGNRALAGRLFSEARKQFLQAIKDGESFAQGDPLWADAHRGLAKAAAGLGQWSECQQAAQVAYETDEAYWGPQYALIGEDLYLMGESMRQLGNFEQANGVLQRALTAVTQHQPDTHQQNLDIFASLIMLNLESGVQ